MCVVCCVCVLYVALYKCVLCVLCVRVLCVLCVLCVVCVVYVALYKCVLCMFCAVSFVRKENGLELPCLPASMGVYLSVRGGEGGMLTLVLLLLRGCDFFASPQSSTRRRAGRLMSGPAAKSLMRCILPLTSESSACA